MPLGTPTPRDTLSMAPIYSSLDKKSWIRGMLEWKKIPEKAWSAMKRVQNKLEEKEKSLHIARAEQASEDDDRSNPVSNKRQTALFRCVSEFTNFSFFAAITRQRSYTMRLETASQKTKKLIRYEEVGTLK